MRLPPGTPSFTPWTGVVAARTSTQCEGYDADRGSPPPQCPAVRRYGDTALIKAADYDRHAIVQKLLGARADLNTKNICGCALPRGTSGGVVGGGRWRADCACAVRQVHSAAHSGALRPHQMPCGAARRRRRPDHHGQRRVTLCRRQPRRRPRTESARIGAGERLANQHKVRTRTTRRWRRCGRRHRPRAPPHLRAVTLGSRIPSTVNGRMRPLVVNGSVNGPLTAGAGPLPIGVR